MSMSQHELRRRGLNFVRRQVAAGKATKKDLERGEKELGPEVRQIAKDAAPPKATSGNSAASATSASKSSTTSTAKES